MTQPSDSAGRATAPVPDLDTARPAGPAGPGVPLSVWPGLPAPGSALPGLPCAGPVTVEAARQVIESFSRRGDLVAVPGDSPAVIQAAVAADRPVLPFAPDGTGCGCPRSVPDPVVRLRPGGPALVLAPGNPVAGQAALAVAGCHGPGCCAASEPASDAARSSWLLYAAAERVLRPGGVLAVVIASQAGGDPDTGLAGGTVAAARAAGLAYAQHIVLVHAAVDGDRLDPAGPPLPAAGLPGDASVHSDLLVFTKSGGTRL
jgi:hypothetical protein